MGKFKVRDLELTWDKFQIQTFESTILAQMVKCFDNEKEVASSIP